MARKRKPVLTKEQQAEFVELWRTAPNDEICRRYGLSLRQVNGMRNMLSKRAQSDGDVKLVAKLGPKPRHLWQHKGVPSQWTDELERQTIEMRQEGMSSTDIASVLGFSRQYIIKHLARMKKQYGYEVIGSADRSALTREYAPIDGHDYNALYPDVPWQCRISGRCQVAGIPR